MSQDFDIHELKKLEQLGKGTYGSVYLVKRPAETMVMKQLDKKTNKESAVLHEVQLLQAIKQKCHLYATCLIDFQSDDKFYYILTNYEGNFTDLYKVFSTIQTPIPNKNLHVLMINLLKGLKYLHDLDIVHRDVKPDNILD